MMATLTQDKQILVVDDNIGDLHLIEEALSGRSDIAVHAVMNASQAGAFLARRHPYTAVPRPHMVFLDLRLPLASGYNVLSAIKGNPLLRHIKVVVFTSGASDGDRLRCLALGADDFVLKPNDWPQWHAVVSSLVSSHLA